MTHNLVYTVGHSTHTTDEFRALLTAHNINCIIDVRSMPVSKYNPQFNRNTLAADLRNHGIAYLHFGPEFGARQTDCLDPADGKPDFARYQQSDRFLTGIRRLRNGLAKGYLPALMCAEADPMICHRISLLAGYLSTNGLQVRHILKDGTAPEHTVFEDELLERFAAKLPQPDLFSPDLGRAEQLRAAYRLHNKRISKPAE